MSPDVKPHLTEPLWLRCVLIAVVLAFLGLFLFLPLVAVFAEAFRNGAAAYLASDEAGFVTGQTIAVNGGRTCW